MEQAAFKEKTSFQGYGILQVKGILQGNGILFGIKLNSRVVQIGMHHVLTAEEEDILALAATSYQSASTLQITQAAAAIRAFILGNYPSSLAQLQKLITLKSQVSLSTRKSLISHIKAATQQLRGQLANQAKLCPEVLGANKRLLHEVEHMLSNSQIEGELKQPLAESYVQLFILYMPQTYEKLISKARYYFNIREDLVGLHILESYHRSSAPYKYKYNFYNNVLALVAEHIYQKIKALCSSRDSDSSRELVRIGLHLDLFCEIWSSLVFEKHESTMIKLLSDQKLVSIFQIALSSSFPQSLLHYLYQIASQVLPALRRTGLYKRVNGFCRVVEAHVMEVLKTVLEKQFSLRDVTEDYEIRHYCAGVKLLIAGVDAYGEGFHLVQHRFTLLQIYTNLIYPNFRNVQQHLYNLSSDHEEVFSFLEDLSFGMKSECPQILIHKFIVSLAIHSSAFLADLRTLIYTFLYGYACRCSDSISNKFRVNYDLSLALPFWSHLASFCSFKEQLLSVLLLSATTLAAFQSDLEFMADLNDFMGVNADFFLFQDPQVQFFSLLIYRNYRADIFSDNKASAFKGSLINKGIQMDDSLNRNFILKILLEQFSDRPCFDDVFYSIQLILKTMANNFNEQLLQIVIEILRNYWQDLHAIRQLQRITEHVLNVLQGWARNQFALQRTQNYFQLIALLVLVQKGNACQSLFYEVLWIQRAAAQKHKIKGELMLSLCTNYLKRSKRPAADLQLLLVGLQWQFTSAQVVNEVTSLVKQSKNSVFLNSFMQALCSETCSVHTAILMMNLAYFKGDFFNRQTIKIMLGSIYYYRFVHSSELDYIHAKLNLALLFLLKLQKHAVYELLLSGSWQELQRDARSKAKYSTIFHKDKQAATRPIVPIIEQLFSMLYAEQEVYLSKHDIQTFLITQLKLFQADFNDSLQLSYANVAMATCIVAALRVYEQSRPESSWCCLAQDEEGSSLFEPSSTQFQGNAHISQQGWQHRQHQQLMECFERPEQFNEDYFKLFRGWVSRLKGTHQSALWLQTILSKVFGEKRGSFEELLKVDKCEGRKLRTILRVQPAIGHAP